MIHNNEKEKNLRQERLIYLISLVLFILYLFFISYRLFFYAYGGYYRLQTSHLQINLFPFRSIIRYLFYHGNLTFHIWFINIFGNIFAFSPIGFFVPIIFKRLNHPFKIVTITFLFSFLAETIQAITGVGAADIDDIILNTLGGYIGYLFYILVRYAFLHLHKESKQTKLLK